MPAHEGPRGSACCGVMDYVRKHMWRVGDTEKEAQRKAIWVVFLAVCNISVITTPVYHSTAVITATFFGLFLWVWVRREVSEPHLRLTTVCFCASIFYFDMLGGAFSNRWWPLFVIMLDVLLVVEAPRYLAVWTVAAVVVWLFVVEIEYATRTVGLFDIPDSSGYDVRRETMNCAQPPCAHEDGFTAARNLTVFYTIFVVDFLLTRGFADKVLAEKKKMAAAVGAAEYLAAHLAGYDLEAAAAYLERQAELPDELAESFTALLANLRAYRPYLPSELFCSMHGSPDDMASPGVDTAAPIPGLIDPNVTLVFSDIRASTALWEHSEGTAMQDALTAHNEVMRTALAKHGGYEVKTIGDSFMISFQNCIDAVRFGHAAQTALGTMTWPEGLMRPNADDGFAMLAVRMGIHCGVAVVQRNALTGRYDYFGPTVNRAARVEPFGAPGAVAVTAEVVAAVGGASALADAEGFVVVPYAEERSGKGLRAPLVLTALIPSGVGGGIEGSVRALVEAQSVRQRSTPASGSRALVNAHISPGVTFQGQSRGQTMFTATAADDACVGVIRFASFDLDGANLFCKPHVDTPGRSGDVVRAEYRLQVLHDAVRTTRGHLTSVVSGTAWVSWGLQMQCPQHVNQSSRCMLLLHDKLAGGVQNDQVPSFHAGLVTGPLATAELAASSGGRRFVTLLGACVELGVALCVGAASTGAWVLAASADGSDGHAQLAGARRAAGLRTGAARVEVYEVDLASLAHASEGAESTTSPQSPASPVYYPSLSSESILFVP